MITSTGCFHKEGIIMKIKICGLTSAAEAEYLNEHQVDFAGIVMFFPKSKRNTTPKQAAEILAALDPAIHPVAVVVSPSVSEIAEIEQLGFDYIQIHGNLPDDILSRIHLPVLKAFNVADLSQLESYRDHSQIAGFVFDAQEPGSGVTFDWSVIPQLPLNGKLLLLAGGLNAGNVEKAIATVKPDGVDVSSGVEYDDRPGKDPRKIALFVNNVRKAQNI